MHHMVVPAPCVIRVMLLSRRKAGKAACPAHRLFEKINPARARTPWFNRAGPETRSSR